MMTKIMMVAEAVLEIANILIIMMRLYNYDELVIIFCICLSDAQNGHQHDMFMSELASS